MNCTHRSPGNIPCFNHAQTGKTLCRAHDPERKAERIISSLKAGETRRRQEERYRVNAERAKFQEDRLSDPPFDSKPCPMCPWELRNLYAVANNYLHEMRSLRQDQERQNRLRDELEDAVSKASPLLGAHFANEGHWRGR